ncbi:MAG TPA: recombinase family protein [Caulobacter sp.]|nr:recombinase family protein [Caulobacter sp.]HJV43521.1 recombinase family protein [Caulobacter sp.]
MDRLGRTVRQLVDFTAELRTKEANFASLTDGIYTGTAAGRFFFHVMVAMAEMERDLVCERTLVGLAAANARGRLGGRPSDRRRSATSGRRTYWSRDRARRSLSRGKRPQAFRPAGLSDLRSRSQRHCGSRLRL